MGVKFRKFCFLNASEIKLNAYGKAKTLLYEECGEKVVSDIVIFVMTLNHKKLFSSRPRPTQYIIAQLDINTRRKKPGFTKSLV